MSRHYDPHRLDDSAPHPVRASWRAATEDFGLMIAWLSSLVRRGLEWVLKLGARPSATAILEIRNVQCQVPGFGEIERELRSVRAKVSGEAMAPGAADRRPRAFED